MDARVVRGPLRGDATTEHTALLRHGSWQCLLWQCFAMVVMGRGAAGLVRRTMWKGIISAATAQHESVTTSTSTLNQQVTTCLRPGNSTTII